jgi:hypothetical protein
MSIPSSSPHRRFQRIPPETQELKPSLLAIGISEVIAVGFIWLLFSHRSMPPDRVMVAWAIGFAEIMALYVALEEHGIG